MKTNKRGITTKVLISLIIFVIVFVIMLFLFFYIRPLLTGEVNKQTCHLSVVLKSTLSFLSIHIPLRCQTEKICFVTSSNEECESFKGWEYEKVKVSDKEDIFKGIADLLYECWWVMGEGQINIFKGKFGGGYNKAGVICSRYDFSNEAKEKYGLSMRKIEHDEEDPSTIDLATTTFDDLYKIAPPFIIILKKNGEIEEHTIHKVMLSGPNSIYLIE